MEFHDGNRTDLTITDWTNVTTAPIQGFSCEAFKPPLLHKFSYEQFTNYIKVTAIIYKLLPFIGGLSVVFNIFNVIIWTRRNNRKFSISYYLIALAISDVGLGYTFLIKGLDNYYLYSIKSYRKLAHIFILLNNIYLPYVFGMSNFWITMALTIERAICIALPTKAR